MSTTPASEVDPVLAMPFRISRKDRIVTAGSCFAQQISHHLRLHGFRYLVTEPAHPILPPETAASYQYGVYSARYGNIYTSRQLLQLLRRAYGRFVPQDDVWPQGGRYVDPFRPGIQPDGFSTREEYEADRRQHLAAVRRAFETMQVFLFTLGLTECWASAADGAVYPMCPGVVAGTFDPAHYVLLNLSVDDVVSDMTAFLGELRVVNPTVRTVLSISPVPPIVTAQDRHVLISTACTQAVLRVAADRLIDEAVAYFPAYEIVTGAFARGSYFGDDLRSITAAGIDHVMRLFFRHATEAGTRRPDTEVAPRRDRALQQLQHAVDAICDDSYLEARSSSDPAVTS